MTFSNRQTGTALVTALLILLLISVIGVAAMRSSALSGKVALGVQLDAIAFDAAESAIAETLTLVSMFNDSADSALFDEIVPLFNGEVLEWCIARAGELSGKCPNNTFFDSRNLVVTESRVASTGFSASSGNQISTSGGGGVLFADFELTVQGNSELPSFGISNRHVQHVLRSGMIPGQEIR